MDGEAGGASHQRLLRGRDPVLEKDEESFGGKMISNFQLERSPVKRKKGTREHQPYTTLFAATVSYLSNCSDKDKE